MKRILLVTNILMLFVIILFACNSNSDRRNSTAALDIDKLRNSTVRIQGIRTKWDDALIEKGFENPPEIGLISFDAADSMSKLYKKDLLKSQYNQFVKVNGELGFNGPFNDATSIWFSLDMLKEFIASIELSSPKGEDVAKPKLGIRIYYAKYPNDISAIPTLRNMSPDVRNKHTLFMVPMYEDIATKKLIDFNPKHIGSDSSRPLPYYKLPSEAKKTASILGYSNMYLWMDADEIKTLNLLNHGGLSPPPEDGGTFPSPNGNN